MPSQQIAQNLAFINWTILSGLAIGSYAAVVLGQFRTTATKGYLGFVAFTAAVFGGLALLADGALPARGGDLVGIDTTIRTYGLVALSLAALMTTISIARAERSRFLAIAGLTAAVLALAGAALAWSDGSAIGAALLFVQLGVLAAATGGVWAAMILGHWYLVTPKLPEAPLVLFARILLAIVGLQVVLFAVWLATGAGPAGHGGFAELTGPWAIFVWLRFVVGLIFPLVVSWAAIQTARTRSMESATGLLYINVGSIAAGTILAAGLYFGAGILA
ncbi:MAG TPA: hypothetical protein VFC71_09400 [Candidatus Polarisedimenticolia bacterium]|nr:hypothetical protein [Candidatus Polarisedimenticolia bacterium]